MKMSFEKCDCKVSCRLTNQMKSLSNEDINNNIQNISNPKDITLLKVTRFDENLYSIPNKISQRPSIEPIPRQSTILAPSISASSNSDSESIKNINNWRQHLTMAHIYILKTGRYMRREIPYDICCYVISMSMIISMIFLPLSEPCFSKSSFVKNRDTSVTSENSNDQLINNLKLSNHSSMAHYQIIPLGKNGNDTPSAHALNTSASDHDFTATAPFHPSPNHIPREESSTLLVRDYLKVTKKSVGGVPIGNSRYDSGIDTLAKGPLASNPATLINKIYPFYPHPFIQRQQSDTSRSRHDMSLYDNDVKPLATPSRSHSYVPDIVYGHPYNKLNDDKIFRNDAKIYRNEAMSNNLASESNGNYVSLPIPDHLKNATLDWFKKVTNSNNNNNIHSPISNEHMINIPSKYTISGGRIEYRNEPGMETPIENRFDFRDADDADSAPGGYVRNGRMIDNHNFNMNKYIGTPSNKIFHKNNKISEKKKRQKCYCQEVDAEDADLLENMIEPVDPMATGYTPMLTPPEMKASQVLKSAGISISSAPSTEKRCLVYESSPEVASIQIKRPSSDNGGVPLIRDYVTPNGERIVVPTFPLASFQSNPYVGNYPQTLASSSLSPSSSSASDYRNQFAGVGSSSGQQSNGQSNDAPSRTLRTLSESKNWWDRMKMRSLEPVHSPGTLSNHPHSVHSLASPLHLAPTRNRDTDSLDYESLNRAV